MNIGIVTFTTGDNFGQRLQNYALQEIIESFGNSVKTIRRKDFRLSYKYNIKRQLKAFLNSEISIDLERSKCFKKFDDNYILYYKDIIDPVRVSLDLKNNFDIFIAGSDQIWSPLSGDVDSFYFLDFAEDEQKYSYAASFSVSELPENKKDEFQTLLQGFKNINVREQQGAMFVEKLLGRTANVVLDPTLLLTPDKWTSIENKPRWFDVNKKYILKYLLGNENSNEIEKYAKQNGLEVIDVLNKKNKEYVIGPSEFLFLIHNAEIVYTDSYHGTIFSILYEKKFVHCVRNDNLHDMSSRFNTLFNKLGIHKDGLEISVSHENVNYNLEKEKRHSFEIIKKMLNKD